MSGDMYKHVGTLRAIDIYWNKEKAVLFHLADEPLEDDSPRISVRSRRG
jgi:hypothetical protein